MTCNPRHFNLTIFSTDQHYKHLRRIAQIDAGVLTLELDIAGEQLAKPLLPHIRTSSKPSTLSEEMLIWSVT
jgi:hypothetical protein